MAKTIIIDGVRAVITNPSLGQGGQGLAQKAKLYCDPAIELVVKSQTKSGQNHIRARKLTELNLSARSPYLAGPIVMTEHNGKILHLSPFVRGKDIENDRPRTFPELVEVCHHLACQWCVLEEQGVAHGDIAPSNVMVSDEGAASLIDFDNFTSLDASVPSATMAGQTMMTAPEIRLHNRPPTLESDRYAYAVLFNLILLRRHPSDGLAQTPKELLKVMTTGKWPERVRPVHNGETPIAAMGDYLPPLFDASFAVDPMKRPNADQWRRGFNRSLQEIYIHSCGQAFIKGARQKQCPLCQGYLQNTAGTDTMVFKVLIPSTGTKYSFGLTEGQSIFLGRNNLGQSASSVSNRHLSVTRFNHKIHLHHIGRHPSAIYRDGRWYNLREIWLEPWDYQTDGVLVRLADLEIQLGL